MFKISTVVHTFNRAEEMGGRTELRVLAGSVPVGGFPCKARSSRTRQQDENACARTRRGASSFSISQEQWEMICDRHEHLRCYVSDDKQTMAESYLNDSLLDVEVKKAR